MTLLLSLLLQHSWNQRDFWPVDHHHQMKVLPILWSVDSCLSASHWALWSAYLCCLSEQSQNRHLSARRTTMLLFSCKAWVVAWVPNICWLLVLSFCLIFRDLLSPSSHHHRSPSSVLLAALLFSDPVLFFSSYSPLQSLNLFLEFWNFKLVWSAQF